MRPDRHRVRERGGWLPSLRLHDWRAGRVVLGVGAVLAVSLVGNAALAAFGYVWASRYDGVQHVGTAEAWRYVAEFAVGAAWVSVPLAAVALLVRAGRVVVSLARGGFTLDPQGIRGAYARPLGRLPWSSVSHLRWEDRSRTSYGHGDVPGGGVDSAFQPMTLVAVLQGGGLVRVGARHLDGPARRAVERQLLAAAEAGCCPVPTPGVVSDRGGSHVRVVGAGP